MKRFPAGVFATACRFAMGTAAAVALMAAAAKTQQPSTSNIEVQREAMRKLAFLAGHWSGPVTIVRGPGETVHLTQTESVEYKLDGLVLLLEGRSTGGDGKAQFAALATIAYDEAAHAYRIRAYNGGHYLDTEVTVLPDGFSWGFEGGPAHIVNTMHLTPQGQWQEATDVSMGNNPPRRSVDMLLQQEK
jgi:hypothetical protein